MSLGGIRSRRVGFVCVLETGSTINAKKSLRYGDIKRKSRDRVKDIDIYIFFKKNNTLAVVLRIIHVKSRKRPGSAHSPGGANAKSAVEIRLL
jgi:hypothetical protein